MAKKKNDSYFLLVPQKSLLDVLKDSKFEKKNQEIIWYVVFNLGVFTKCFY